MKIFNWFFKRFYWKSFWQLNLIIAMMSHTYDKRLKQNDEIWKIEIFSRIIRYEKQFPELWSIAHKPQKVCCHFPFASNHIHWSFPFILAVVLPFILATGSMAFTSITQYSFTLYWVPVSSRGYVQVPICCFTNLLLTNSWPGNFFRWWACPAECFGLAGWKL